MKRVLALLFTFAALSSCAQTRTIVGSTVTVAWDAPALGTIPPAEIAYEVVLQPYPTGTAVLVATTAMLTQVVTFTAEGSYRVAVRVKRTVAGDIVYSPYALSDVAGSPSPWYVVSYVSPLGVMRLRIQ